MQALRERARLGLQGDELPESLAALRGLQAIEPSLATTCNLGMVARRLGSSVEAVENLSRCMTAYWLVPADGAERALVEEIAGELAMARAAVAVVSLQAPRGAAVTIDGQPMGAADIDREYFLEPGWHTLAVTNGAATSREKVNLARGAARTIQLISATARSAASWLPGRWPSERPFIWFTGRPQLPAPLLDRISSRWWCRGNPPLFAGYGVR